MSRRGNCLEAVEAVARVTRHPTGLTNVAQLPCQLEHADLGTHEDDVNWHRLMANIDTNDV
jgi:hypothetical protein